MLKKITKIGLAFVMLVATLFANTSVLNAEEVENPILEHFTFTQNKREVTIGFDYTERVFSIDLFFNANDESTFELHFMSNDIVKEGNHVTATTEIPGWDFWEEQREFQLSKVSITGEKTFIFDASQDVNLSEKQIILKPEDSPFYEITKDDFTINYYGENEYISLVKGTNQYFGNYNIDAKGVSFYIDEIIDNPAMTDNVELNTTMPISIRVSRTFCGEQKSFQLDNVNAQVIEAEKRLNKITLTQNGLNLKMVLDYSGDDVYNLETKFVSTIDKNKEADIYFERDYEIQDAFVYNAKIDSEYFEDELQTYTLEYLSFDTPQYTEVYELENDIELLKGISFTLDPKDNPFTQLTAEKIKYNFTTPEKYIIVYKDTNQCTFGNIYFYIENYESFNIHPKKITKINTNGTVTVEVQVRFNEQLKSFELDIPAKVVEEKKGLKDLQLSMDKQNFKMGLTFDNMPYIQRIIIDFVNKDNPSDNFSEYYDVFDFKIEGNVISISDVFDEYEFPTTITDYYVNSIHVITAMYNEKYTSNDKVLQNKYIRLDPKYSPLQSLDDYDIKLVEWSDQLIIQEGTGTSNLDVLQYELVPSNNYNVGVETLEIIDNPAKNIDVEHDTEVKVSVRVKARTRGGLEKEYIVEDVPAIIYDTLGTVVGDCVEYEEYAIHYLDFLSGNYQFTIESSKEMKIPVVLNDGTKSTITLYSGGAGGAMLQDEKGVAYLTSGRSYIFDYRYKCQYSEKDKKILSKYMKINNFNSVYFSKNKYVYLMDENNNLVNQNGEIIVTYDQRGPMGYLTDNQLISLDSKEGSLPRNTELKSDEKELDIFKDKNYVAYDMSVYANDKEIQPIDDVTVGIKLPENLIGKDVEVVYVKDDGTISDEKYETKVVDGEVQFVTDHFSTYVVVEKVSDPVTPDENIPWTDVKPSTPINGDAESPDTGDYSFITMFVGIAGLSLLALVALLKRKSNVQ